MKIAVIGASGFGNVGDDGYRLVFAEHLAPAHELVFDSPYPDLRTIEWADAVIIGGGGLIYCNETAHFEYMSSYLDRAIELRKPVVFLSCGVQVRPHQIGNDIVGGAAAQAAPWGKYLEYASLVTLRSPTCVAVARAIAPAQRNIHFVPDACFVLPRSPYRLALPDSTIFIPTARALEQPTFQERWRNVSPKDCIFIAAFSRDDLEAVDRLVQELGAPANLVCRRNLSVQDAMAIVQDARLVVTGRYHGAVFARAAGVPASAIVSVDQRFKDRVEIPPADPREALRHFELLHHTLEQLQHAPQCQKSTSPKVQKSK